MEYVRIPAPAGLEDVFPQGIEVRKDLYESGDQTAINQALVELGGKVIPMSEWDRRLQFVEGVTSTGRGVLEATGLMEEDLPREMRNRMVREGDPLSMASYFGGAVAEFIPATAIKALSAPFKGVQNPILRTALEFGAVGGALGLAQPVYEELGDDRLTNAMTAGGIAAGAGGIVAKFLGKLGAKNEWEFLDKWEKATPEQKLELEKLADEYARLESPDAMYMRKQDEAATARAEADAKAAEINAIRTQGDQAGEAIRVSEAAKAETARIQEENAQRWESMRLAREEAEINAKQEADYQAQLKEVTEATRQERIKELETTMRSKIVPAAMNRTIEDAVALLKKNVSKSQAKLKYIQKQIDNINAGKANTGTNGRGINALRAEAERLNRDLLTDQGFLKQAEEVKLARKELVALKKNRTSPVVEERVAAQVTRPEPVVLQPKPREPVIPTKTEQVPPEQFQAIPEGMVQQSTTSPQSGAGRIDRLGTPTQKVVDRATYEAEQAAFKQAEAKAQMDRLQAAQGRGTGGVPPTGNATPQGTATPPPRGATEAPTDQGKFSEGLDKFFGSVSTRLGNISKEILGRARKHEFNVSTKNAEHLARVEPFMRSLVSKIPDNIREDIALKLFNGDHADVMRMLPPEMRKEFAEVQKVLKEFKKEFDEIGLDFHFIDNYFPRRVKDYDGLLKHLGREKTGLFEDALNVYAKKNSMSVKDIPAAKRSEILDQVVRGVFRKGDTAIMPNAKQRKINRIEDPKLLKFYEDPATSLSYYIQNSRETIESAKFFGRGNFSKTDTGDLDAEKSIGHLINKLTAENSLSPQQQKQLHDMLRSRFIQGVQAPDKFFATVRDLGYMGTIGNPISALTQLGDIGVSLYRNGIAETIGALFGKKNYTAQEMGIEHTIAHELQNERATSKALNKMFTAVGFRAVDRLGKSTYMTAAIKKNQNMVGTVDKPNLKGEAKFREKWGKIFGDDIDSLITDLRQGNKTDNTRLLAFNELSEVQPISLIEMPQKYLDVPNGRLMYMLKSFTLKQIDLVRRDIVQEAKKGNVWNAGKNAFLLSSFLAATGTSVGLVKDWMRGREASLEPDALTDRAMWSVLSVFGMNQYITDRYLKQGDIMGALQNTVTPAAPIVDMAGKAIQQAVKKDGDITKALDAVPSIKSTKQIIENFWMEN